MSAPTIVSLAPASDWWLLVRLGGDDEEGAWRRFPLACWALVNDGVERAPWVVGLEAGLDVELAREGRYVHGSQLWACGCSTPRTEQVDGSYCTRCSGVLADG